MFFNLTAIAAILLVLSFGDTIISLFFYVLYIYDGGRKSFRDYHCTMSNLNMDDWEEW